LKSDHSLDQAFKTQNQNDQISLSNSSPRRHTNFVDAPLRRKLSLNIGAGGDGFPPRE
jgi:hypothetical protein